MQILLPILKHPPTVTMEPVTTIFPVDEEVDAMARILTSS